MIDFKSKILSLLLLTATCHAGDFRSEFIKRYPFARDAKIAPAFPGYWSVVKNSDIIFVAEDLSIMINGEVIDLKTNTSLTNNLRELNKPSVNIALLKTEDAIQIGTGERKLYIFSDPDCPYCQSLEAELTKLKNVSIFLFPFPLTQLHPNAAKISESIWCSKDKASAWRAYLLNRTIPKNRNCENPIQRNIDLGVKFGINGTPSIIFEDGTIIPGAIDADRIEGQLKVSAAKKETNE